MAAISLLLRLAGVREANDGLGSVGKALGGVVSIAEKLPVDKHSVPQTARCALYACSSPSEARLRLAALPTRT